MVIGPHAALPPDEFWRKALVCRSSPQDAAVSLISHSWDSSLLCSVCSFAFCLCSSFSLPSPHSCPGTSWQVSSHWGQQKSFLYNTTTSTWIDATLSCLNRGCCLLSPLMGRPSWRRKGKLPWLQVPCCLLFHSAIPWYVLIVATGHQPARAHRAPDL